MAIAGSVAVDPPPPLKVGSWPGYESRYNPFVTNFLDGLQGAGCEIVSLPDPTAFAGAGVDILILHWVDRLFWTARNDLDLIGRVSGFLGALRDLPEGTRIVWLVHNLAPHDARGLRIWLWRRLLPLVANRTDAFLTLSPGTVAQVRRAIPGIAHHPALGFLHPTYRLAPTASGGAMRNRLGIPPAARVIGYAGNLRPYKGLDQLVTAFRALPDPDLRLILAGGAAPRHRDELSTLAADDRRILIEASRLDPVEFDGCLLACDLIAAPFHNYLHSGSMVHALSAGKALLTPRTAFSESLAEAAGADWVTTYDGPLSAETLSATLARLPNTGQPGLAAFQPDQIGRQVGTFLREVCAAPRRARSKGGYFAI